MTLTGTIIFACSIFLSISIISFVILLYRLQKTKENALQLQKENEEFKKSFQETEEDVQMFGLTEIEFHAKLNNISSELKDIELKKKQLEEKVVHVTDAALREKQSLEGKYIQLTIEKERLELEKKIYRDSKRRKMLLRQSGIEDNGTELIAELQQEIEDKNKFITTSIGYAKRITESLRTAESGIEKYLSQSFVLKDSQGDFSSNYFWYSYISRLSQGKSFLSGGKTIVAAVDSKRHGIQSAFINIFVNTALMEIVNEKKITQPDIILNQLSDRIRDILIQNNAEDENGLEAAVCCIDTEKMELQYAGAHCPLYLFASQTEEKTISSESMQSEIGGTVHLSLSETGNITPGKTMFRKIEPDLFSIAGNHSPNRIKFTNNKITVNKGDTFYIFTDGYLNLFGRDKAEKFQSLLCDIQPLAVTEQKFKLRDQFETMKQKYSYADDALVIGMRI